MAKPRTLKEYYQQQQKIFQPILNVPAPDYLDVESVSEQEIEDYIEAYEIALYRENQVRENIVSALSTLNDGQLKQVYARIKGPKPGERGTEADFIENVRKGYASSVFRAERYDSSLETMLDVFGETLGRDKVAQIIAKPILPHPMSRDYRGSKVYDPFAKEIQDLRDKYTRTGDPVKNQQAEALLNRVSITLQAVKPEILQQYDDVRTRKEVPGYECFDDIVGRRVDVYRAQGLQELGGGSFKDNIKPSVGGGGAPDFSIINAKEYQNHLTQQQEQQLDQLSRDKDVGLSEDTRQALRELSGYMDQLNYDEVAGIAKPLSGQVFPPHRPAKEGEMYFEGEQGEKYYAFWPLKKARDQVLLAVMDGDLEKIRQAQEKYEKTEQIYDKAFAVLKSEKLFDGPLFAPNTESTRSSTGDLPEKFALDTTNHKKLNCLFIAYTQLKSAGLTLEDLITDPAGTAKKIGKGILDAGAMNSRPGSIGASLQNGMKGRFGTTASDTELMTTMVSLDSGTHRGISGIVGLEKDPKRRGEFMAAFHLGLRSGMQPILEEVKRYELMTEICRQNSLRAAGMLGTIYQNAALRPETGMDRFDLKQMIDSFRRPDVSLDPKVPLAEAKPEQIRYSWQDDMDAVNKFADGSGEYDWKDLAGRNKKVIKDAAREEALSGSYKNYFDQDEYLLHAFAAQSRLMQNAAARGENSPEFQEFRQSVLNTYKLAKDPNTTAVLKMGAELLADPAAFDFLHANKADQIVKSDSDEYKTMKQSLDMIRKITDHLASGDPVKTTMVSNTKICKALEEAKQDTFNYVRLKLKNGTKTSFHYQSGRQRAKEALANYRKLAKLQDQLELRSPAQKAFEDARLELLLHRGNERWLMGQPGRTLLSKMIYTKSVMDAGLTDEQQKAALAPETMQKNVDRIRDKGISVYQNRSELEALADGALENRDPFKKFADHAAAARREALAPYRLKQARQDLARGFAMDLAASSLNLDFRSQTFDNRNPVIQNKADEIMKDSEFKEVMRRMAEGKTAGEIRQLHNPARLDVSDTTQAAYNTAKAQVDYEKRCASVVAEALLQKKVPDRQPSQEEINKFANRLRKDVRFNAFVREKENRLHVSTDYENAIKDFEVPEKRTQFLTEMAARVTEPIPQVNVQDAAPQNQVQNQIRDRQNGPAAHAVNP